MKTQHTTTKNPNPGAFGRSRVNSGLTFIGGTANLSPKSGTPFLPAARGPRPNTFFKTNR
jgi:hypothetical protein